MDFLFGASAGHSRSRFVVQVNFEPSRASSLGASMATVSGLPNAFSSRASSASFFPIFV